MILFHGTTEENVKNIKKNGLFAATKDQWLLEITENKSICCLSKRPISGEGGNPLYFARDKGQNGYLVVVRIHLEELVGEKLIAIFDNKTLDDYTQKHFFCRQEFREKGYDLFLALTEYKIKDRNFKKLDDILKKIPATDNIIFNPQDQRTYYRQLRKDNERFMINILGIEVSDEFYEFMNYIGNWQTFYEFLQIHFNKLDKNKWDKFIEKNLNKDNKTFWEIFYQNYPLEIKDLRRAIWKDWFSINWLKSRQVKEEIYKKNIDKNSQVLVKSIEPEYILDIIQITTPSGILPEFCFKAKSGLTQAIWKRVDSILGGK